MPVLFTRLVAVLLTVLPWATAFLALPKAPKSETSLSSPASPSAPQAHNAANLTPNTPNFARDGACPVAAFTLEQSVVPRDTGYAPRPTHPDLGTKLYRVYAKWQLEGA